MPVVIVKKESFLKRIGCVGFSDDDVQNLCFKYGLELDDVTSEQEMAKKETGVVDTNASTEILFKIEVPANRPELLCEEGLAGALAVFLEKDAAPVYITTPAVYSVEVTKAAVDARPYITCAVLSNVNFNDAAYRSLLDHQEKLHDTTCRRRTLASIGVHDLDKIRGTKFLYDAQPPADIECVPLPIGPFSSNKSKMAVKAIFDALRPDAHLGKYLSLVDKLECVPVLRDGAGEVMSLPPIINGSQSMISSNTKNIFIEVTATDRTKADLVLNLVAATFSEYCEKPYQIEAVNVVYPDGRVEQYPHLQPRLVTSSVSRLARGVGIPLERNNVCAILTRMGLKSEPVLSNSDEIQVTVGPLRSDIMAECDIVEDVAIAIGYDNLKAQPVLIHTVGQQNPLNAFCDKLRHESAQAGFTEVMPFILHSTEENFGMLRQKDDGSAVKIGNPKTKEFQVARTTLLPGLLKMTAANKNMPLPMKIFESADVVLRDETSDVFAKNQRHLGALYAGVTSGFETIHGFLDHIMAAVGASFQSQKHGYSLVHKEVPYLVSGRSTAVVYTDANGATQEIGVLGTVHPEVSIAFGIPCPVSVVLLNVEALL